MGFLSLPERSIGRHRITDTEANFEEAKKKNPKVSDRSGLGLRVKVLWTTAAEHLYFG